MRKIIVIALLFIPIILTAKENSEKFSFEIGGTLIGSEIYLSYISIDLINESIIAGSENTDKLKASADVIKKINNETSQIIKEFKFIPNLSYEDNRLIYQIDNLYQKIDDELELLIKYLDTKSNSDYMKFVDKHKEVWNSINKLVKDK